MSYYYEVANKLVSRMNRAGITTSKELNLMVTDFVQKMTLERASKFIEVIKVY